MHFTIELDLVLLFSLIQSSLPAVVLLLLLLLVLFHNMVETSLHLPFAAAFSLPNESSLILSLIADYHSQLIRNDVDTNPLLSLCN